MKIREVEQRCGLTSKAIRYYEEKGLLQVKRNRNAYREYDEACVQRLNMIKLLRGIGISIADIKRYVDEICTLEELLKQHYAELDRKDMKNKISKQLCIDLQECLEKGGTIQPETYQGNIQFMDSEEFNDFSDDMAMLNQRSIFLQILITLVLLGPILILFIDIMNENFKRIVQLSIISIIMSSLITMHWINYIKHRKEYRSMKKGSIILFIFLLLMLILIFVPIIGIQFIIEHLWLEGDYIMWVTPNIYIMLSILFGLEILFYGGYLVYKKTNNRDIEHLHALWKFLVKHFKKVIIINIVLLYVTITNIDIIYKDHIVVRRWYHPFSQSYSFQDIDNVETGFSSAVFSLTGMHKGDFYYYINLKNGKRIDISLPSPAKEERYEIHTYLEIEEFDKILMDKGVKKETSEKNESYNDLGKEYKDRFLRIIRNN